MPTGNHVTRWLHRNELAFFVCFVNFVVPSLCHAPLLGLTYLSTRRFTIKSSHPWPQPHRS